MHAAQRTVAEYMSKRVQTITPTEDLAAAQHRLDTYNISSLGVLDEHGALCGVLSRTDLLRAARTSHGQLLTHSVWSFMTPSPVTVSPGDSLRSAASLMIERRIHRVFVTSPQGLVGVLSTKDLVRAVKDSRDASPIEQHMTAPVMTVESQAPISAASAQLGHAKIHGLVVVEDEWPVGLYTQVEALQAATLDPQTPVEQAMSYALLCLPTSTPLYRAAAHSLELEIRRILAVEHRQTRGILTDFDLARTLLA
jgi:CBS domain-containing protein